LRRVSAARGLRHPRTVAAADLRCAADAAGGGRRALDAAAPEALRRGAATRGLVDPFAGSITGLRRGLVAALNAPGWAGAALTGLRHARGGRARARCLVDPGAHGAAELRAAGVAAPGRGLAFHASASEAHGRRAATWSIVGPRPELATRLRATHDRAALRAGVAIDAFAVQTSVQRAIALPAHPLALRRAKLGRIRCARFAARRIGFAHADAGAVAANAITRHVVDECAVLAHLHFVEAVALVRAGRARVDARAILALRFAGRVLPDSALAQLGLAHFAALGAFGARVARAVRTAEGAARFGRLPRAVGVAELGNRARATPRVRFTAAVSARAADTAAAAANRARTSVGSCATIGA
jgi:hypothetical protein